MTQKQISLMEFEEKVDTVIQSYLHYENRIPTLKELSEESHAPDDKDYEEILLLALEEVK